MLLLAEVVKVCTTQEDMCLSILLMLPKAPTASTVTVKSVRVNNPV